MPFFPLFRRGEGGNFFFPSSFSLRLSKKKNHLIAGYFWLDALHPLISILGRLSQDDGRGWWSLPMSAPLLTLTSRRELRHFPLIISWSIWFLSLPFGEHHAILWISRCGKGVPPITRLFVVQNSTSLSPVSLMMPLPCLPSTLSLPELSAPTLAFRSPMMMIRSCIGTCISLSRARDRNCPSYGLRYHWSERNIESTLSSF